jgi:hypothetical protein
MASCATILHPERKGNRGGPVDVVPLVVDILLFIPGLIPGLIAIIVDFGTGAIYTGGGSADVPTDVPRHGKIAFRAREMPSQSQVKLRLLDKDGTVLDADQVEGGEANQYGRLAVDLRHAAKAHRGEADVPRRWRSAGRRN